MILGDVITAIDGKKIESPNDLYLALEKYKVGDAVNVTLLRDGQHGADQSHPESQFSRHSALAFFQQVFARSAWL